MGKNIPRSDVCRMQNKQKQKTKRGGGGMGEGGDIFNVSMYGQKMAPCPSYVIVIGRSAADSHQACPNINPKMPVPIFLVCCASVAFSHTLVYNSQGYTAVMNYS